MGTSNSSVATWKVMSLAVVLGECVVPHTAAAICRDARGRRWERCRSGRFRWLPVERWTGLARSWHRRYRRRTARDVPLRTRITVSAAGQTLPSWKYDLRRSGSDVCRDDQAAGERNGVRRRFGVPRRRLLRLHGRHRLPHRRSALQERRHRVWNGEAGLHGERQCPEREHLRGRTGLQRWVLRRMSGR